MPPTNSTTWKLEAHTKAKHEILREYLKAWFPIMTRYSRRVVYLDGFAGPGIYSNGEEGSPVIAIQTALKHRFNDKFKQIVFWFTEKDPDRFNTLQQTLTDKFPDLENKEDDRFIYVVKKAEFASQVKKELDELEQRDQALAPTFALLDPFGFAGLPMSLIKQLLQYKKCEVLITFMVGFVIRFLDELRESALNELFGSEEWKKTDEQLTPEKREKFLIDLYVRKLKEGGAKFVRTFRMVNSANKTIYYLVYATKHRKGLDVIKKAMLKVGEGTSYRFSDRTDPCQTFFLDYNNDDWKYVLGNLIYQKFKGKTVSLSKIEEFVSDSPFIFQKNVLKKLEQANSPKIINVQRRIQSLSYPDGCILTFGMD